MNISGVGSITASAASGDSASSMSMGMLKKELEMQKQQMAQLLQTMGIGQNVNTTA